MTFEQKLRTVRKCRNISRNAMADAVRLKPGTYGAYEEGRATPPLKTLLAISRVLQVTMEQLVDDELEIEMTIK